MLLREVMKALPKILLALTAVAALSVAYPAKANLITNPGFETGNFTGWTEVGVGVVGGPVNGVFPHSGNFQAVLAGASLSQSVATTPSASYTIGFWLASSLSGSNSLVVTWGGSTILTLTNQSAFGYTHYTFTETTSTVSTALAFNSTAFRGGWHLDDISVEPAGAVPDGGTTVSLLGCALVGLAGLRRRLGC